MMAEETKHEERSEMGGKPGPRRQCAGCAKRDSADALVRVVLEPNTGMLAIDLADSRFGRGALQPPEPGQKHSFQLAWRIAKEPLIE